MKIVFFWKETGETINNAETFVVDENGQVFGLFDPANGYYKLYEAVGVGFRVEEAESDE